MEHQPYRNNWKNVFELAHCPPGDPVEQVMTVCWKTLPRSLQVTEVQLTPFYPEGCQPYWTCFQAPPRAQFCFYTVLWQLFSIHLPLGPFLLKAEKQENNKATITALHLHITPQGTSVMEVWAVTWVGKAHAQSTHVFPFNSPTLGF